VRKANLSNPWKKFFQRLEKSQSPPPLVSNGWNSHRFVSFVTSM